MILKILSKMHIGNTFTSIAYIFYEIENNAIKLENSITAYVISICYLHQAMKYQTSTPGDAVPELLKSLMTSPSLVFVYPAGNASHV